VLANSDYTLNQTEYLKFGWDNIFLADVAAGKAKASDGSTDYTTLIEVESFLRGEMSSVNVISQPPFATPEYRIKHYKVDKVDCEANNTAEVDFLVASEIYIYGGSAIVTNFEIGDWIEAGIYDEDEVIPEAYRAALCENWPLVASYVVGEYLLPKYAGVATFEINTKPLIAKITAGLYLKVIYHAINAGNTRSLYTNYFMLKKL
jgi:hypothetical protein